MGGWFRKLCLMAAVSALALWGCHGQEDAAGPGRQPLTLWYYWDVPGNQRRLKALAQEYNQMQDEAEINLRYVPDEDFKKQLALSTAEGKRPDMALVDSSDFQFFHQMEPFADLTEELPQLSSYLEQSVAPCTVDGHIYGMPFGMNCTALFYNQALLDQAGVKPPETWEEFEQAAGAVSALGVDGFALTALQTEECMYEFLPMLWSMGGSVDDISGPQSRGAFDLLGRLSADGALSRQSISLTMGDLTNQFLKGNIGMMFNSSMAVDTIREKAPELAFGVAPVPGGQEQVTVVGGEILAVSGSGHTKEAVGFLKFLADKERMADYMDDFGFLAPRRDVMEQQYGNDPVKGQFAELFRSARLREISPQWPRISLALSETVSQVIIEDGDRTAILDGAAAVIGQIRREYP